MLINGAASPATAGTCLNAQGADQAQVRVGIVSDFLEEEWPSMDLVADMLAHSFQSQPENGILATRLRPAMRRRFTRIPFVAQKRMLWNADRFWNRFLDYPHWLRRSAQPFEIFHLVDHSYSQLVPALPAGRSIVTCHDLDTFRCLLEPERESRGAWFRAMARRILDGFERAAHVIAVSAATRAELLRFQLVPPERITVIPNGVHPSCSPLPNPEVDDAASRLLGPRLDVPLLLNVGSTLPRKRLDVLLRVFAEIRRTLPEARLIRVGGFTEGQLQTIRKLNLERAVTNLPILGREVLAAVYRRATLLLHTSEAEGFGLPVIEALASGCPVVASDLPVLREVGGAAVAYCRVADVSQWKNTVLELLEQRPENSSAWESRRQTGLAWAAQFSWAENARQTAKIYRKLRETK